MVMAIALLPNQKLNEGFDEVRRMYRMEIQNFIGRSENENIQKFLEYYSRTWLTGNLKIWANNVYEYCRVKFLFIF